MASARHSTIFPADGPTNTTNTNLRMGMGMARIPSMYFRPPSPHTSRASTAFQTAQMNMHPLQFQRMHLPNVRSSASSAASNSNTSNISGGSLAGNMNGNIRYKEKEGEREIVEQESGWEKEWKREREVEREREREFRQPQSQRRTREGRSQVRGSEDRHRAQGHANAKSRERSQGPVLKEKERERSVPVNVAPKMGRRGGSSSSSSGSSWGYSPRSSYAPESHHSQRQQQQQRPPSPSPSIRSISRSYSSSSHHPTRPKTPIPAPARRSPSRVRSRRHSVSFSTPLSRKPSVRFEDERGRGKTYSATVRSPSTSSVTSPASPLSPSSPSPPLSQLPSTISQSNSIPHLREALSTLESQMASLMSQRLALESKLEFAVRQQTPVHRLPRELLGSIFEIGVHHMADEEDTVLLSTIMLVCKGWREVVLNTPVLWSRIVIDGGNRSIQKARLKLGRSGAVPLDIFILFGMYVQHGGEHHRESSGSRSNGSRNIGGPGENVLDGVDSGSSGNTSTTIEKTLVHALELLKPSLWRWRTFKLAVPTRGHAYTALGMCREAAPLLETFVVHVHHVLNDEPKRQVYSYNSQYAYQQGGQYLDPEHQLGNGVDMGGAGLSPPGAAAGAAALLPLFQGRLPKLRSLSFTSFNFGWDSTLVRKLRVLRLNGYWHAYAPNVSTLLSVLRACPGLEELALRNMSDVEEPVEDVINGEGGDRDEFGGNGGCYYDEQDDEGHDGYMGSGRRRRRGSGRGEGRGHSLFFPREEDMIRLPRLRHASFYYSGPIRTQAIFAHLVFPALESIELSYLDNVTPILKHLKTQASMLMVGTGDSSVSTIMPLKRLRIEASLFNELKLVRVLRKLRMVKTLELVDVEDVSSDFLDALSAPTSSTNEWICPKLEVLNFDGSNTIAWDSLRDLVEARLPESVSSSKPSSSSSSANASSGARGNTSNNYNNNNGSTSSFKKTFTSSSSASSYYAAQQRSSSLPSLHTPQSSSSSSSAYSHPSFSSASGSSSASSYYNGGGRNTSSASSSSASFAKFGRTPSTSNSYNGGGEPQAVPVPPCSRLRVIDLTRCGQISKEMIQWLRMYVDEVRCESERTYWGEVYGAGGSGAR